MQAEGPTAPRAEGSAAARTESPAAPRTEGSATTRTEGPAAARTQTPADYALTLRDAEKALAAAATASDIRNIWKQYNPTLGHRTLGRLLLGRRSTELLQKHDPGRDG